MIIIKKMIVTIYYTDDLEALYFNKKLVLQGHDVIDLCFLEKVLESLGVRYIYKERYFTKKEIEDMGFRFPEGLLFP